jgi:hypothetical protein
MLHPPRHAGRWQVSALTELVAKWRDIANQCGLIADRDGEAAYDQCADELEAALATPPAAPTDAVVWMDADTYYMIRDVASGVTRDHGYRQRLAAALLARCRVTPEVG